MTTQRLTEAELIRALRNVDVDALRPMFRSLGFPNATGPRGNPVTENEVITASIHKARLLHAKLFTGSEKEISRQWLREHGYEVPGRDAR